MNHADHVDLLRLGATPGGVWADLGSGTGAFTLALADLLGPQGIIHTVDQDSEALAVQEKALRRRFPRLEVHVHRADFTRPLKLPPLDGLVIANALHFVRNKAAVLPDLVSLLRPGGRFILVEYNVDRGNEWVPYPISFARWEETAPRFGLRDTSLIGSKPSRFLGEIYSAGSVKEAPRHRGTTEPKAPRGGKPFMSFPARTTLLCAGTQAKACDYDVLG